MNRAERKIIPRITIGSTIEWYEMYLYFYWAPTITGGKFDPGVPIGEFINTSIVLIIGFFGRALGGWLFGILGDTQGRARAFFWTILLLSIPSFMVAFFNYATWDLSAVIVFCIVKLLQGIPAGGELPGAMCFFAENAAFSRRRYLTSYTLVGPQIGQILAMSQTLILEMTMPRDLLLKYGWRISFIIAGSLGLYGLYLRRKLNESPFFSRIKEKHEVLKHPVHHAIKHFKKQIFLGFCISIFEVSGFFVLAFFLVEYAKQVLNVSFKGDLFINIGIMTSFVIMMPLCGKLGDRFKNKTLFIISAVGVIVLSGPLYWAVNKQNPHYIIPLLIVITLFMVIQFSLLPALLVDLFPTKVRFTCLGFSFNLCSSVVGGGSAILCTWLLAKTGNQGLFIAIWLVSAIIFLICLKFAYLHGGHLEQEDEWREELV